METDPVCGMTVEPARAAATRAHDGHTYSFCARGCAVAFEKEPWKYVGGSREPIETRPAQPMLPMLPTSEPEGPELALRSEAQLREGGSKARATQRSAASQSGIQSPKGPGDEKVDLAIEGMHCASCVRTIETALEGLPGVSEALVNLGTGRAQISGRGLDAERLVAAVEATGYGARTAAQSTPHKKRSARPGSFPTS